MAALPDQLSSISGDTLERAKKELFEVPEKREEVVAELRAKVEEKESIPEFEGVAFTRKDGPFLLRFLRARKFDVERAATLYCNYYRYRHKYAHFFRDLHPRAVEDALTSGVITPVPLRRKDGSRIIFMRPALWNPEAVPFVQNYRALLLLLERLIEDEETQVHGIALLNNLQDVSFITILKISQTEQIQRAMLVELLQDSFPCRFKGMHLVNQPWYVSLVLTVVRPFMKQKMRDRFVLHGSNYASLCDYFDPDELPESLGGGAPEFDVSCGMEMFAGQLMAEGVEDSKAPDEQPKEVRAME